MSHPLRDINAPPLSHKCQACLDIVADDFWGGDRNRAFFDVWVFSPFEQELPPSVNATRMRENQSVWSTHQRSEHGSFSPLVFSTAGGMRPTASVVYKRIGSAITVLLRFISPFITILYFWYYLISIPLCSYWASSDKSFFLSNCI